MRDLQADEQNFEKGLERLKEIVEALERNQVSLDQALTLFQEGVGLIRFCNQALLRAEEQICLLYETPEGEIEVKPWQSEG